MTEAQQPALTEREVHVERAKHARAPFDTEITAAESVVGEIPALRIVAHFTSGVFDYSVARSAERRAADDQALAPGTGRSARIGQRLDAAVVDFDKVCRVLDCGALIRVVVQGEHGALLHYLKADGQTVFAYAAGDSVSEIRRADRGIAGLLVNVARRRGVSSLNWGGYATEETELADNPATGEPDSSPGSRWVARPSRGSTVQQAAVIAQSALDVQGLHYLAMHRDGQPLFERDILDDEELAGFFQRVSPLARRIGYTETVRTVGLQARLLNLLLARMGAGNLVRLVLDVARGAVYVMPVGPRTYVTGVTLLQSRVDHAEAKFRQAAEDIREALATLAA